MAGRNGGRLRRHLGALGARRGHGAGRRSALVGVVGVLMCVTLFPMVPAYAFPKAAPTMRIIMTKRFFGTQFLSVSADDLSHPDHATFTITSYSELWYRLLEYPSDPSLIPVAANPPNDLLSQTFASVDLLPPTGILPINSDFSTLERIHLQVRFTRPDQQVRIVFNAFDYQPAAFDVIHQLLLLAGDEDAAAEIGLLRSGAIKEAVKELGRAGDLANVVIDVMSLLTEAVSVDWAGMLGTANAFLDDVLKVAADSSELAVLAGVFALTVGRSVARKTIQNLLNVVGKLLAIGDGAKYLADLVLSFGNYLIYNDNYPTITLSSIAITAPTATPTPSPTAEGNLTVYPVSNGTPGSITAGPDQTLWVTLGTSGGFALGRLTPDGIIKVFPVPSSNAYNLGPYDLVTGPDGAIWFTEPGTIGRMTTSGAVTTFPADEDDGQDNLTLTVGPDGNLWYTDSAGIGRITPDGHSSVFPVNGTSAFGIAAGADGNLWFTGDGQIGKITPSGAVTLFPIPAYSGPVPQFPGDQCSAAQFVNGLEAGPDGNLWMSNIDDYAVLRITTGGTMTWFPIGGPACKLASGPDGDVWFTDSTGVGRITPAGTVTFPLSDNQNDMLYGITGGPDGTDLWLSGSVSAAGEAIIRYVP